MTDAAVRQSDLATLMRGSPALAMLPPEQLEQLVTGVGTLHPDARNEVEAALAKEQADLARLKSEYDAQVRVLLDEYMTAMKEKESALVRGLQTEMESADKVEEAKILDSLLAQLDTL